MVFIGGGLGSIARFLIAKYAKLYFNTMFPLGTFMANILGCLLIGVFLSLFEKHSYIILSSPENAKNVATVCQKKAITCANCLGSTATEVLCLLMGKPDFPSTASLSTTLLEARLLANILSSMLARLPRSVQPPLLIKSVPLAVGYVQVLGPL